MKRVLQMILAIALLSGCAPIANEAGEGHVTILPVSRLHWEPLNPARGDKGPQAATLWGDRAGTAATGFLVRFVDGFSSPAHVHNVSYRGIVMAGLIHNGDPGAVSLWIPKRSYWMQPAGGVHITAARGEHNIAFIEIDSGPYLVLPQKRAFDNGERPFNTHAEDIIWDQHGHVEIASLWKNKTGRVSGSMLRFRDRIELQAEAADIVLIEGSIRVGGHDLNPGSLIRVGRRSNMGSNIGIACAGEYECVLYVRSDQPFTALAKDT